MTMQVILAVMVGARPRSGCGRACTRSREKKQLIQLGMGRKLHPREFRNKRRRS